MSLSHRLLTIYSVVLTMALAAIALAGLGLGRDRTFEEISVQRINVVEPDGTLRMVISNHDRLPGIVVRGNERDHPRPQAGMLFYNDEASEVGGLIFGGHRDEGGAIVDSGASLSFDKYEANQIVSLYGVEDSRNRFAGLAVSDSPSGSEVNRRVWLGRGEDGVATLALMDAEGQRRLLLEVTPDGEARFSRLDAAGRVVEELLAPPPPATRSR